MGKGDEVWIYFVGPHQFPPGVYAKCRVLLVDYDRQEVLARVHSYSDSTPLTDAPTNARIGKIVATRYRQVFVLPDDWETVPDCNLFSTASSCSKRRCDWCPEWRGLQRIDPNDMTKPARLPDGVEGFAAAYWAIPSRCYLSGISMAVHRTTQLLSAYKTGNGNLAFPIALGMMEVLHDMDLVLDYDCIVPIPLSPDKIANGEINRTLLISRELSRLLNVPSREYLQLSSPISKRRMLSAGYTYTEFERAYADRLVVADEVTGVERLLLVDDVSTHGGTLKIASQALWHVNSDLKIVAAAGMQMVLKAVVRRDAALRA